MVIVYVSGGTRMILLFSDGTEIRANDVIERNVPMNEDGTFNVSVSTV